IVTVGLFVLALAVRSWGLWLLAIIALVLSLWVVYFFRDPVRDGPRGAALVIAPADGRVVMITNVEEPAFLGGTALRISIFMNVFNVHVNRYPVDGVVRYLHYNPGKFLNAASDKASLENEQMSVGIQSGVSRVLVRQIAGLIARRIVSYATMDAQAGRRPFRGRHLRARGAAGMSPNLSRPDMRRAVVLLPNGFTLGNLFFGV